MVIFITSKSAYSEMESLIVSGKHPIWLTCDVLSEKEYEALWKSGVNASVLDYVVDTENIDDMSCAMSTIKEHHAGQNIWVQILNEN
ncbi:hypothetical protein [Paraglaciecola marina]|uniref:hypothetical protein n=1 Tax=Paraglaciecola marina TaxID=2500157 RepID=UPI00105DA8D3|nr:hypothetical protein [Paraglaciecola marina]